MQRHFILMGQGLLQQLVPVSRRTEGVADNVGLAAGGTIFLALLSKDIQAAEAGIQETMLKNGRLFAMRVKPSTNNLSGTLTITIRIGGIATTLTLVIAAGSTAVQTITPATPVKFTAGNLLSIQAVAAAGTGAATYGIQVDIEEES